MFWFFRQGPRVPRLNLAVALMLVLAAGARTARPSVLSRALIQPADEPSALQLSRALLAEDAGGGIGQIKQGQIKSALRGAGAGAFHLLRDLFDR